MRTVEAALAGTLDASAAEKLADSVALDCVDATGYLASESLMFRALKGAIPPYLHAAQHTVVHAWAPATGTWRAEVRRTDERGATVTMEAKVWREEVLVLEQRARLHMVGGDRPAGRAAAPSARGVLVGAFAPRREEVVAYSGWGHPNVHTDERFARSVGLSGVVVQGLMIQNRLVAAIADAADLAPPVAVAARFRAPVPVGTEMAMLRADDAAGPSSAVAVVDGRVVCETTVGPPG